MLFHFFHQIPARFCLLLKYHISRRLSSAPPALGLSD